MQKKFIALAVAAAVAAPMAAAADVTIYGQMHASWDFVDTNDAANDDSDDVTGTFRASRLGFKGDEDLGDGLSAIWQVETQVQAASNSLALRNTFVGLKGGWGQVRMGRHDTPYKIGTGSLDIFSDTAGDYNNIIGTRTSGATGFDERVPQTVAYITPSFNGFTAAIARVSTKLNEGANSDETEAWSGTAMYDNGPLFASLSYEQQSGAAIGTGSGTTATDDVDAWKLGLGYKFGSSKVGFVYEDISHGARNSAAERNAWYINFAHEFGANTFKIAYGAAEDSDAVNSNDGADNWTIGLDHAFSKRTSVYALYTSMDNDRGGFYGVNAGNDVASGAVYAPGAAGKDVDVFSLGIVHKF